MRDQKEKSPKGRLVLLVFVIVAAVLLLEAVMVMGLAGAGVIQLGKQKNAVTTTEAPVATAVLPEGQDEAEPPEPAVSEEPIKKKVIVLDPGHGMSSSSMTSEEKEQNGWVYSEAKGGWGEWRHWKTGTVWQDCQGSGCNGRAPKNGSCWYPIGHGDRDTEPELTYQNVMAAKVALEQMGYTVRVTRTEEENPSMTKRLTYCYPDGDITKEPDADAFVCVHANAGGGRGSYYISLSGTYDQAGIPDDYIQQGNAMGAAINQRVVAETGIPAAGSNGSYQGYPELVLFFKSPIPIAYMEIGFYDHPADLEILRNNPEGIGQAIAKGVDDYFSQR